MAAPSSPTGTVQHIVYVKLAAATSDPGDLAKAKTAVVADSNKLVNATSFGPIDLSGNPVSFTPLGSGTTKTVAGAADLGELPIRFVPVESVALDASLVGAKVGTKIQVGLLKKSGSDETIYYARGEISGLNIGFDTPAEAEIRIALAANPVRYT